jgi:arginyl-tRNA synthetase
LFQIGNSEKDLIKLMSQFKEMVEEAGRCYSPAIIANYAYELAKAFNTFYQNFPVLNEENETLKNARLMIVLNIGKIIRLATSLLGIQVPDRM